MEETATVTDISFLKHFTSGDKQMMTNLIETFFITASDALQKMEKEIETQDWERVGAAAHSFKPQLSYMGIKLAEPIIGQIEDCSKENNTTELIPVLFISLKSIIETAIEELKKVTERLS